MQTYKGVIKEVGVNLSITKDNTMVWGVIAPEKDLASPDELKGTYLGGTGQVEIGGGVAANILIGGSHQTISLQPVSVNGMIGAGAALDITAFELMRSHRRRGSSRRRPPSPERACCVRPFAARGLAATRPRRPPRGRAIMPVSHSVGRTVTQPWHGSLQHRSGGLGPGPDG